MNHAISDHGEDDPIAFDLTPSEREAAAFAQVQLRWDAMVKNAKGKPTNVIPVPMDEPSEPSASEMYLAAERAYHHHNRTLDGQA